MAAEPDAEGETKPPEVARPAVQGPSLTRFAMIFLALLGLWAMFDNDTAKGFAFAAGILLDPLIGFGARYPVLTILLAGLFTTTISSILRDRLTDWIGQASTQKWLRAWQKERLDAVRKGNKARLENLQEAYRERQKDLMALQASPLKSFALTIFLFIVVFTWLRLFVTEDLIFAGNLWIAVPWSSNVELLDGRFVLPVWLLLYSLLAIPFGQIVSRVLRYVRFRRRLEELGVPVAAEAGDVA